MLLGSTNTLQQYGNEEALIIQLIAQRRYAEAYLLLKKESPGEPATLYNLALCHYWAGNSQEALICLDKAARTLSPEQAPVSSRTDQYYNLLRQKQNQTDDHLQGVTKKYVSSFRDQARDNIIRLQTDCWLQAGNYAKVIETAGPIQHKNYKNITEALQLAKQ